MTVWHRHKWKKVEIWGIYIEEDLANPTYERLQTAAEGYQCRCGARQAKYYNERLDEVPASKAYYRTAIKVMQWLNREALEKRNNVVHLKVVK